MFSNAKQSSAPLESFTAFLPFFHFSMTESLLESLDPHGVGARGPHEPGNDEDNVFGKHSKFAHGGKVI